MRRDQTGNDHTASPHRTQTRIEAEKRYVYISPANEENLQGNFGRSTQFRKPKLNQRL